MFYIASPDIASDETLATLAARFHGDAAPEIRADGRGAPERDLVRQGAALIGYDPQRSWRDYLDDDGRLRPAVRERLERGATGVQRGRRMTGATGPRVALDEAAPLRGSSRQRGPSSPRPDVSKRRPAIVM